MVIVAYQYVTSATREQILRDLRQGWTDDLQDKQRDLRMAESAVRCAQDEIVRLTRALGVLLKE